VISRGRVQRSIGFDGEFIMVVGELTMIGFVVWRVSRGAFVTGFGMGVEASIGSSISDVLREGVAVCCAGSLW
jgi:hypothetical protein